MPTANSYIYHNDYHRHYYYDWQLSLLREQRIRRGVLHFLHSGVEYLERLCQKLKKKRILFWNMVDFDQKVLKKFLANISEMESSL